jgi:hypothetical protein
MVFLFVRKEMALIAFAVGGDDAAVVARSEATRRSRGS